MPSYRWEVIYDNDEVIVQSFSTILLRVNKVLEFCGLSTLSSQELRLVLCSCFEPVYRELGVKLSSDELWELHNSVPYDPPLYDGFRRVLVELSSKRIPLHIVSANTLANVRHILDRETLGRYFLTMACTEEKQTALRRIVGLSDLPLSQIIYIGDSVSDMLDGRAVGLEKVVGFDPVYDPDHTQRLREAGAYSVIHRHIDLLNLLE